MVEIEHNTNLLFIMKKDISYWLKKDTNPEICDAMELH